VQAISLCLMVIRHKEAVLIELYLLLEEFWIGGLLVVMKNLMFCYGMDPLKLGICHRSQI
jgi:hypothetical protein